MSPLSSQLGIVIIGRNEGQRLVRCLQSVLPSGCAVVYVDSGSIDASVRRARGLGADVVCLDAARPFTAARARNAGVSRLRTHHPGLAYVQLVDGDCEVHADWLQRAAAYLDAHCDVAVVCGHRRERRPEASPYNQLADMEWAGPLGDVEECGGDAMMRLDALGTVGGYDARLIAGEDPELCLRLRRQGHRIVRLDCAMTWHDIAIFRFEQWWRRTVRAGYSYAALATLHGRDKERYRVRQLLSAVAWGGALPLLTVATALPTVGGSMGLLSAYGWLWWRIRRRRVAHGQRVGPASLYASACVVGKLAEMQGVIRFAWQRWGRGGPAHIIEYKGPAPASDSTRHEETHDGIAGRQHSGS